MASMYADYRYATNQVKSHYSGTTVGSFLEKHTIILDGEESFIYRFNADRAAEYRAGLPIEDHRITFDRQVRDMKALVIRYFRDARKRSHRHVNLSSSRLNGWLTGQLGTLSSMSEISAGYLRLRDVLKQVGRQWSKMYAMAKKLGFSDQIDGRFDLQELNYLTQADSSVRDNVRFFVQLFNFWFSNSHLDEPRPWANDCRYNGRWISSVHYFSNFCEVFSHYADLAARSRSRAFCTHHHEWFHFDYSGESSPAGMYFGYLNDHCPMCIEDREEADRRAREEREERRTRTILPYGESSDYCERIGNPAPSVTDADNRSVTLVDCGFELEFIPNPAVGTQVTTIANSIWRVAHADIGGIERDGSIRAYDGAEVVSHYGPIDRMNQAVTNVCQALRSHRCLSHSTKRLFMGGCDCGFHVSLSRVADSKAIARLVCFWNDPENREFLKLFTRRWGTGYCKPNPAKGHKHRLADNTVYEDSLLRNNDRYELINLQNRNRIEIRAYRGSTKADTLRACLELSVFSMAYCQVTENARALSADHFCTWLKGLQGPTLPTAMMSRIEFKS